MCGEKLAAIKSKWWNKTQAIRYKRRRKNIMISVYPFRLKFDLHLDERDFSNSLSKNFLQKDTTVAKISFQQ